MGNKKIISGLALLIAGSWAYWWYNKNKKVQVEEPKKIVQQPRKNPLLPNLPIDNAIPKIEPPIEKDILPIYNPPVTIIPKNDDIFQPPIERPFEGYKPPFNEWYEPPIEKDILPIYNLPVQNEPSVNDNIDDNATVLPSVELPPLKIEDIFPYTTPIYIPDVPIKERDIFQIEPTLINLPSVIESKGFPFYNGSIE